MLDQGLLVFIEIKIDHTSPEAFDTFAKAIRRKPEVIECHIAIFSESTLTSLPGIRETHTYPVTEEVKSGSALLI
jgi:Lrp/AsnC family transcriptional regulator, leucine-responsive regulatory protein